MRREAERLRRGSKVSSKADALLAPAGGCRRAQAERPGLALAPADGSVRGADVEPSTGSIPSLRDNATVEPPTGPIEVGRACACASRTRDRSALEAFGHIERFCNRAGARSAPGGLSPAEFEAGRLEGAASRVT